MPATEGATLSGTMTVTGRTSGETVKAPKGQVSVKSGIISQAKGQSGFAYTVMVWISEVKSCDLAFSIFTTNYGGNSDVFT